MSDTLVIQSHTQPLPDSWLQVCIDSVINWAKVNEYEYKFIDNALFDYIDQSLLNKLSSQLVIATDLARLNLLQSYLDQGYHTVIWCDADFLIFSEKKFTILDDNYALGREVWIQQHAENSTLVSKRKVHNAFMMFKQGNTFLKFYIDTAQRLLESNNGSMSPQFIGPKLLTALHNVIQCPVVETAGMLSPLVMDDITHGGGSALNLFIRKSSHQIYAANLCHSLFDSGEVKIATIEKCISKLLDGSISFQI